MDVQRAHKTTALIVDMGHRIKPVITPNDPDEVIKVLSRHGIHAIT